MKRHALIVAALACPACAQSINIDFGVPGSSPSPSYAAVGRAGAWNTIGVMPTFQVFPLVGLSGQPIAATLYNNGGSQMLDFDNPATTGDDAALMDDMFLSLNDPVDLCLYFEGLKNGLYEVVIYAMTPDNPSHQNRVRVDFSTPGPTWIGGQWPGAHQSGITYSRHTVTVTNGKITPHSGQYNAFYQSGMNGLQLIYLGCYPDCNGDDLLNLADFGCFQTKFALGDPYADCNGDGVRNLSDFGCFQTKFALGCP